MKSRKSGIICGTARGPAAALLAAGLLAGSGACRALAEQTTQDADKTIGDKTDLASNDDDLKKKGGKTAQLVRTAGRVTVILPQVN